MCHPRYLTFTDFSKSPETASNSLLYLQVSSNPGSDESIPHLLTMIPFLNLITKTFPPSSFLPHHHSHVTASERE
jgi:hypothetical protein